ncbi:MAG: TIGR00341 family protein [Patescibacteria group bacterium]
MLKKKAKDHLFRDIKKNQKDEVVEKIFEYSCPRKSFFMMMILSAVICTMGILMDNAAVIIGAMLVAPMLASVLAVSLGVVMADFKLIFRSLRVVLEAFLFSLGFSYLLALALDSPEVINHEMFLRMDLSVEGFVVALAAGLAAALSFVRKELSQYITGTVIAVALVPPISMAAIALRMLDMEMFYSSLVVFGSNIIGIVLTSILVFSLTSFYSSRKKVDKELKEEDNLLNHDSSKEKGMKAWLRDVKNLFTFK